MAPDRSEPRSETPQHELGAHRSAEQPLLGPEEELGFEPSKPAPAPLLHRPVVRALLGLLAFALGALLFIALTFQATVSDLVPLTRVASLPHSARLDPHHIDHRLVLVGDVHGMSKELKKLLRKIDYNHKKDTLVFLGDLITKGYDSLGVVDFAIKNNAYCVRGNHEDEIMSLYAREHHIEAPRTFTPYASVSTLVAGEKPTATLGATVGPTLDAVAVPTGMAGSAESAEDRWSQESPEGSEQESDPLASLGPLDIEHELALEARSLRALDEDRDLPLVRKLKRRHIEYLAACPAILKLGQVSRRGIEAVAVHGGLMWNEHELENQNITDVLRIRSIVPPDYEYGSEDPDDGKPWFGRWNKEQRSRPKEERFEVFYGHDASKGLQLRRYSKGLDTRCQRGGKLSAYVVRVKHSGKYDEELVQVKC